MLGPNIEIMNKVGPI